MWERPRSPRRWPGLSGSPSAGCSSPPTSSPPTSPVPWSSTATADASRFDRARCSPTSCWPTSSTGPRPRRSRRCSSRWRSTRSARTGSATLCRTPFMVIATQNPYDAAGTFPLPHSQRDRFLLRLSLGYPDRDAEDELLATALTRPTPDSLPGVGGARLPERLRGRRAAGPCGPRGAGLCPRSHRRDAVAPRSHGGRLAPRHAVGAPRRRRRGRLDRSPTT